MSLVKTIELKELNHFFKDNSYLSIVKRDKPKKANSFFKELLTKTLIKKGSKIDWLKSLKLELKIEVISKSSKNLQRIVQLFNRTNQFHLSGNKFSVESFLNQIECSKNIYLQVNLQDRLGSEGLISVIGIEINHQDKRMK